MSAADSSLPATSATGPTAFRVNGHDVSVHADPAMPLLWVLRDLLGLTGTKYGCGIGACGACTVHLDGAATRSCMLPLASAANHSVTTIEGLAAGDALTPLQQAWIDEQVPQCGYCQSGMLMAAAALLAKKPHASEDEIRSALTNLCRCGTYVRVLRAMRRVGAAGVTGGAP